MKIHEEHADNSITDQERLFDEFYGRKGGGFRDILPLEVRLLVGNMQGYGKALDLGCGDGRIALFLATSGYRVTGVDVSQVGLDRLQRRARSKGLDDNIELVHADIRTIPFAEGGYDIGVAVTVLDHLPKEDLHSTFATITRAIRPGGILFAKVHNVDDPGSRDGVDASELRHAIKHYFLKGELYELAEPAFEILTYSETREKDNTHGKPHHHAFSTMVGRRR
jgi:cyclopropane fatty-acyl-phospholipid synthase-like methyltransferase